MRVALLTNVISPYRIPVFQKLAAAPDLQLRVFLSARSEFHWEREFGEAHDRASSTLDVEIVKSATFKRTVATHKGAQHRAATHLPYGSFAALLRFQPDVIITSELGPRTVIATSYAKCFRVPLVIWSYMARTAAAVAPPWQQVFRRALLAQADSVVGMGHQAREALHSLGVAHERIYDAPNAHDTVTFERAMEGFQPMTARAALRSQLRSRENIALVAGRLVDQKGISQLLDAWPEIPAFIRDRWTLAFVGDGPRLDLVETAMRERPGEIAHLPAVAPAAMPALFAASDFLVFPSLGDSWGLVVNEALAAGLPVACSRLAGCADDLIDDEKNGWLFDPTSASETVTVLTRALMHDDRESMSSRAREVAKRFSPDTMALGLRRAILAAREKKHGARPIAAGR